MPSTTLKFPASGETNQAASEQPIASSLSRIV